MESNKKTLKIPVFGINAKGMECYIKYRNKEMYTDEEWPSFLSKQSSESTG